MANTTVAHARTEAGSRSFGEVVKAGILAGIIGGVLMALYGMFSAWTMGMGFLAPLKMIGATFVGPTALIGGAGILLWGLVLHMMVSMVYGVIFAAIVPRDMGGGAALLAGLAYGFAILVLMTWVVIPVTNQVMQDRIPMMWGTHIIEHVLFGVGVSLAPSFRRKFAGTAEAPRPAPQPA